MSTGANQKRQAVADGDASCAGHGHLDTDLQKCLLAAIESMAHGVVIYDQRDRLVFANARYCETYGLHFATNASDATDEPSPEGHNRLTPGMHVTEVVACQRQALNLPESDVEAHLQASQSRSDDAWHTSTRTLPDGRSILVTRYHIRAGHYVATHEDISDRIASESQFRFMANHDALTKLPNRSQFMESLESTMQRVRRGDQVALHLLDLDRFKHINDTHGHPVGDKLLVEVARRLQETVRQTDLVARLGGDEFAIIQIPAQTYGDAEKMAQRLLDALSRPFIFGNLNMMTGSSIGISLADAANNDPAEIMSQADAALYKAKNDGRSLFRFFEEHLNTEIQVRARIENQMREALVKGGFELHYQPIVNLASGRVETCEALLRMRDADGALVPPYLFVPVAEECGLILMIGEWVLRQACIDAASWPEHISVAVNISPLQFKTGSLLEVIDAALETSGLAPDRLEIEITESLLLDTTLDIVAVMRTLREKQIRIAMDDFGTGYSSLRYLTNFPFDKLKIDRSFVSGLPDAQQELAVLRAIASLGASLGLETTVEGVETLEQLDIAREEHCSSVQGYYFARPAPVAELMPAIAACEELTRDRDTRECTAVPPLAATA